MAKNNNPEVRFTGYNEEWEERELGEVLTERNMLQKITEDAPILAFASGQGVIDRSERKSNNRDHLTHDQENKIYKLTELNDIVYNPSNLKYGAIDRNKHGRGVISPIYVTFTTEEEPSFVELIVKSEKFKLRALQYEEGTVVKRQSVKPEDLLSLKVNISSSRDEQRKIGETFKILNKLLKKHELKHKKLLELKEASLKKMLPVDGASKPEIRFDGFTEPWQKKRIGDLTPLRGGFAFKSSSFCENGVPIVKISNILKTGYVGGEFDYYTEQTNDGQYLLPDKSTVLAMSGATTGKVSVLNNPTNRKVYQNQRVGYFENKGIVDYSFISILTGSHLFSGNIRKILAAGAQPNVSSKEIDALEFFIPHSKVEQLKIGSFFTNTNLLISFHKKEIEKLVSIKNACFEKMTNSVSHKTS